MQTRQHNIQTSKHITVNLVILSIILLSSGLITFIAANWSGLELLQKFIIVQGTLICAALGCIGLTAYFKEQKADHLGIYWSNFCLTIIGITAVGGVFALIGQTYQTGADAWQLFTLWTALALPWALYQNKPLIWLFWLVILNTTLLLISDQLFLASFSNALIPMIVNLTIYLVLARKQKVNWLTHLLLVAGLIYHYIFLFFESHYDNIFIVFVMSSVVLLIAFEIYLRKEPISYIIIIFSILVLINSLIHFNVRTDFTFQFLYITLSLIITTVLFFSYLRSVYLKWRNENTVFSDEIQLKMRRVLTLCRSLLGWSISLAASIFILLWLDEQFSKQTVILILPVVLAALLLLKIKILSDSLVNQISCALIYIFCTFVWAEISASEYFRALPGFVNQYDSVWGVLLLAAISIMIMFAFVKNTASRAIAAITLSLILISMIMIFLEDFFDSSYEQSFATHLYYIVVIANYLLIALIIYSDKRPKAKLFRIKPFSLIPAQVWWILLMLIGVYHLVLLGDGSTKKEMHEYASFFYIPMPLFTAGLLWLNDKLPNDTRFKIGLLILSAASYFILPYFSGLNYILTLIFISIALKSRTVLVFSWVFSLLLLTFNYYAKDIVLIDKAFQLAVSGAVVFAFSLLLGYFVKQMAADLKQAHSHLPQETDQHAEVALEAHGASELSHTERAGLSAFLAMRKIRISLIVVGLGTSLFIANTTIVAYEHILNHGEIVRLEIAPVDPRSLIQGDYMRLAYRLESTVQSQLYEQNVQDKVYEGPFLQNILPRKYSLNYTLDENYVMQWADKNEGVETASITIQIDDFNEANIRISHEYFFEEGQAERFEQAKYAEFKRGINGKLLLSKLLDENFQVITKISDKESSSSPNQ